MVFKTIRVARQKAGLTQIRHAQRAGVSLATLQNVENGRANPEVDTLERIAHVVGMELVLQGKKADLATLIAFGLPMQDSVERPRLLASRAHLVASLNKIASPSESSSREHEALTALLAAIRDHYPSVWLELDQRLRDSCDMSQVKPKLRRLALVRLAEYL
jgi:transcriptional regulator with XRE-family HTH domain